MRRESRGRESSPFIVLLASPSHAPNMCTANSCSSENSKKSAFFWAPPPFCNKKALLVRPRSGENEPFRGLGCRFVEQNVAHVSHSPRAADRSTVRSHTKDTHKSTEWKLVIQRSPCSRRRR